MKIKCDGLGNGWCMEIRFRLVSCDKHSDGNTATLGMESQINFRNEMITAIIVALSVKLQREWKY